MGSQPWEMASLVGSVPLSTLHILVENIGIFMGYHMYATILHLNALRQRSRVEYERGSELLRD